jgi:uncharacterized protein
MRRTDKRTTSREEMDEVLHKSVVCHLGFAVDGHPYVVPVSFGYDGSYLYVHTASTGKKIDCVNANPNVCFQVERDVRLVSNQTDPCCWTFAFESVIGHGEMKELTDLEEKAYGLNQVMRHYSGKEWPFNPKAVANTRVWRITIDSLTGKRSAKKED